jgi:hypothetical protein
MYNQSALTKIGDICSDFDMLYCMAHMSALILSVFFRWNGKNGGRSFLIVSLLHLQSTMLLLFS